LVGVNGELMNLPSQHYVSRGAYVASIAGEAGLTLINIYDWHAGNKDMPYATVNHEGKITYTLKPGHSPLPAAPKQWTWRTPEGNLLLRGKLMSDESGFSRALSEEPEDHSGWVLLALDGIIVVPENQNDRPANVLWVVYKKEGGFDLVHSGPLHNGTYATVQADRHITMQEGSSKLGPTVRADRFWPYKDSDTLKPIMVPRGWSVSLKGAKESFWLAFRNGIPQGTGY